jgi:hypothetical protein
MDTFFIVFLYVDEADHKYERMKNIHLVTFEILPAGFLKTQILNLCIRLITELASCHMAAIIFTRYTT